ncbi:MAG: DUF1361 domain-containing protein [Terrimonas sp.]|nr:DUF1361 domain-containing protein [Terrimonas sp.]
MMKLLFKNVYLRKYYFKKSEIDRILILSSFFCIALVAIRVLVTREIFFLFLPWNLFLACIPYAITQWVSNHPRWIENRYRFILVFFLWLLFIPNAFYIITDLFHLGQSTEAPRWYDLAVIFSFAWNGILMGILSVRRMEKIFSIIAPFFNGLFFVLPVMWLNALGIYIGRYLRYNSWDVFSNPIRLTGDILYLIHHPLRNIKEWGMIGCFTLLMVILYESIKRMGKSID